jgi:hypothetical protein
MTETPGWQLAQVNIALPQAPLDTEQLKDFVDLLDPINALAESSPGFVWRLVTEEGDATSIRGFGDDRLIINMSTWRSIDALAEFVFSSDHAAVMRRRREWFEQMREAYTALWWVPVGHQPTVTEAEARVASLREHGPTSYAFTFKRPFAPTSAGVVGTSSDDWLCPA